MSKKNPKVLVVGPGKFVKGGITAVIKSHKKSEMWKNWNCYWLQSFNNRNIFEKGFSICWAFILYLIRIANYDIVHIHFPGGNSIYRKYYYFKVAQLLNKKIILHIHSPHIQSITTELPPIKARNMFEQSNYIITIAKFWEKQLLEHYNVKKHSNIYNSVHIPALKSTSKENIILFAGTLCKRKGYHDLLNAIPLILKKIPDFKIVFAGDGELTEAKELANKLKINNHVEFVGWIDGELKAEIFAKSKVFCLPSYGEGLPMSILEAMSYGIPVVSTPVGGITEVVVDNKTGFIVTPGDVKMIAKKILLLLTNENVYQNISVNTRTLLQIDLSIEKVCSEISDVYEELLK
jgi:glycosyltransferase involved in cell wall biosynthesis